MLLLKSFASCSWQCRQHQLLCQSGGHNPYFLMQVLVFSFHLRGFSAEANPYRKVLLQATKSLPPSVHGLVEKLVGRSIMPSLATLCRARFYLGVA